MILYHSIIFGPLLYLTVCHYNLNKSVVRFPYFICVKIKRHLLWYQNILQSCLTISKENLGKMKIAWKQDSETEATL